MAMKPVHRSVGDVSPITLPGGESVRVVLSSEDSQDALSVTYYSAAPGIGPPLHMHTHEDETFVILEGTVTFRAGDMTIEARKGDTVFAPRGVPHTFKNRTAAPALMLLIVTPPRNFETFYARTFGAGPDGRPPTPEVIAQRMQIEGARAGIQILGPNPL